MLADTERLIVSAGRGEKGRTGLEQAPGFRGLRLPVPGLRSVLPVQRQVRAGKPGTAQAGLRLTHHEVLLLLLSRSSMCWAPD